MPGGHWDNLRLEARGGTKEAAVLQTDSGGSTSSEKTHSQKRFELSGQADCWSSIPVQS